MKEQNTTAFPEIRALQKEIHENMVAKGFWEDPNPNVGERLMLIVTELGEAMEAYRHFDAPDDKLPNYSGLTVELADAVIRAFDLAEGLGLNLAGAMRDKVDYNTTRPYKHNKTC